MKINSELLKEAIADAKAVRVTALANAKAALEESFQKRFEAVFADKLQQEAAEEEEQEEMDEVAAPNQVSAAGGEAKGPKNKDVSKGNPKKVDDAAQEFKAVKAGKGPKDVPNPKIKENTEEDEEEEKEELDEAGLTSEDLDEIIKELEMEVSDEAKGEVPNLPDVSDEVPGEEPEQHAEPDGDEVPAEVPSEEPEQHAEPDGDEVPPVEVEPGATNIEAETGSEVDVEEPAVPGEEPEASVPTSDEEEVNLEELIAALNEEEEDEEEKEEMDEISNHGLPKNVGGQDKHVPTLGMGHKGPDASAKQQKGKNHNIQGKGQIGQRTNMAGGPGGHHQLKETETALEESYKTIEYLRGQINEVNLLNAKLLYTNKLFKEFSTNLDDAYRMKIVEAFDLTKTVREVKLAYALLAESLSFGVKGMKRDDVSVKKPTPTSVKQITEGLASKVVASTKPSKEIISEGVNDMAERFKKLAGIPTVITKNKK